MSFGLRNDFLRHSEVVLRDLGFYGNIGMDKFCDALYGELRDFAQQRGLGLHMVHLNKRLLVAERSADCFYVDCFLS